MGRGRQEGERAGEEERGRERAGGERREGRRGEGAGEGGGETGEGGGEGGGAEGRAGGEEEAGEEEGGRVGGGRSRRGPRGTEVTCVTRLGHRRGIEVQDYVADMDWVYRLSKTLSGLGGPKNFIYLYPPPFFIITFSLEKRQGPVT